MTKPVRDSPEQEVPGARSSEQARDRLLQDRFVKAGRAALRDTRLDALSIPMLTELAGASVDDFQSRFDSREAFFGLLRRRMLDAHKRLFDDRLADHRMTHRTRHDVSEELVDTMLAIFSGPWRGVLREAFARITDDPVAWAPMQERAGLVRARALALYGPHFHGDARLEERVGIALQLLNSALINEMLNPTLLFKIGDPRFRGYLVATVDALVSGQTGSAVPPGPEA